MKKTLNKYKFIILPFIIIYVAIMVMLFKDTNYSVLAPGYNDDIAFFIVVESDTPYQVEGSFHTTSVFSMEEVSMYQMYLGMLLNTVDVEEMGDFYDQVDLDDLQVMNVLMKDDSLQTSLIVGIDYSGKEISYTTNQTVYLVYNILTEDTLEVGDIVLSVDGNYDIDQALSNVVCGETAEFVVERDGEVIVVNPILNDQGDGTCKFGIYLLPYSEIDDTEVDYTLIDTNTGGPSGGLMQSLYVFNQLTEFDYSHGLKIGGTGTIDVDGNVGYIGGIRQKIITAIGNDIDIFFVPYLEDSEDDNYIAALRAMDEFDSDMILVGVSTFEEAVTYLEEYGEVNE